jgi:hypothetical protein
MSNRHAATIKGAARRTVRRHQPAGSVVVVPGNTAHFHCAKSGEYVTQVRAVGPLGLEYVKSNDDLVVGQFEIARVTAWSASFPRKRESKRKDPRSPLSRGQAARG